MHKRTKALAIPTGIKRAVYARDGGRCVICGRSGDPVGHYISRAQGGLGIEQNIVTLCSGCHAAYDNSGKRTFLKELIKEYLCAQYPGFPDELRIYRKYKY